jgi:hypothetical protein
MTELMEKLLAAKSEERKRIASLPIEQKIELLEKLRDRQLSIRRPATAVMGEFPSDTLNRTSTK